jgi:CHASE3 domain sensor protein
MNIPSDPNPLQVASFTERLARERQDSKLGLVFSVISAIGLGAIVVQTILEMMHSHRQRSRSQGWER